MIKHYAKLMYHGVFLSETSEVEIAARREELVRLQVGEYKPYGFQFFDKQVGEIGGRAVDSSPFNESPMHFFGGEIRTQEQVVFAEPESILARNMVNNDYERVIVLRGQAFPLTDDSVFLEPLE